MQTSAMEPAAANDLSLVQETLGGNQLSFQLLVERYQEKLFALTRHYTRSAVEIEDIVQEAFLKAYRRLDTYQQQSSFSSRTRGWNARRPAPSTRSVT